jgi:hypothetical protein
MKVIFYYYYIYLTMSYCPSPNLAKLFKDVETARANFYSAPKDSVTQEEFHKLVQDAEYALATALRQIKSRSGAGSGAGAAVGYGAVGYGSGAGAGAAGYGAGRRAGYDAGQRGDFGAGYDPVYGAGYDPVYGAGYDPVYGAEYDARYSPRIVEGAVEGPETGIVNDRIFTPAEINAGEAAAAIARAAANGPRDPGANAWGGMNRISWMSEGGKSKRGKNRKSKQPKLRSKKYKGKRSKKTRRHRK